MYWKFLRAGAVSPFSGYPWAVNSGQWVTAEEARACISGIHACRSGDLPYWLTDELWGIELAEPVVAAEHKVVAVRARLLDRVRAWTGETARELAAACVGRTAGHAVEELRAAGLGDQADRLVDQPLGALAGIARDIMSMSSPAHPQVRQATKLCGYVVDATEGIAVYPVAAIAYIAARAANQRSGPSQANFYAAERDWQARWLASSLSLDVAT